MVSEITTRVKVIGWKNDVPIIYLKEFEKQTTETTSLLWDHLEYLANNKPFYLIVDVSQSSLPSAELRSFVNQRFDKIRDLVLFIYVFVGDNFLFKITLKFLAASAKTKKIKLIKDINQGLEIIEKQ